MRATFEPVLAICKLLIIVSLSYRSASYPSFGHISPAAPCPARALSEYRRRVYLQPTCEPMNETVMSICGRYGRRLVQMPNLQLHPNQHVALQELEMLGLTEREYACSDQMRFFLCVYYFPPCVHSRSDDGQQPELSEKTMVVPCKGLCEHIRSSCADVLLRRGWSWPPQLQCDALPQSSDPCFTSSPRTGKLEEQSQFCLSHSHEGATHSSNQAHEQQEERSCHTFSFPERCSRNQSRTAANGKNEVKLQHLSYRFIVALRRSRLIKIKLIDSNSLLY